MHPAYRHPLRFVLQVLKGFGRNQGLLLAGAIAYYALLSVVPLLMLSSMAFSRVLPRDELLKTLGKYLEWVVPTQSAALLNDLAGFMDNQIAIGTALLLTMLFFSSLAFSVLEKSMHVIFAHRGAQENPRHLVLSTLMHYGAVLGIGAVLLVLTVVTTGLQTMAQWSIHLFGRSMALEALATSLMYGVGFALEVIGFTVIYRYLPVGRTAFRHALIGGAAAAGLWELSRHCLAWYLTTLSKASVVYGSLTTAVIAMFAMEIAATLVLLGAQVIAEYEIAEKNGVLA